MIVSVVDLEMNQPSGTIIQIGMVQADIRARKIKREFNCYAKLAAEEPLNPAITDLTGISTDRLKHEGVELVDAISDFWSAVPPNSLVIAWGTDYIQLATTASKLGVKLPMKIRYLNLKTMFEVLKSGLPNRKIRSGLRATMETFGLDFLGLQHNALEDARNTARLMWKARDMTEALYGTTRLQNLYTQPRG